MGELKPCPFCGCAMKITYVGRDWFRIDPEALHLNSCPIDDSSFDYSQSSTVEDIVKAWNTRPAENKIKADAVRSALDTEAPTSNDAWISVDIKPYQTRDRYLMLNLLLNGRSVVQGGYDDGKFWMDGHVMDNVTAYQYMPMSPEAL